MRDSDWVYLEDCRIVSTTDKAVLVEYASDNGFKQEWFPRSQMEDGGDHLTAGDGPVTVAVSRWITKEKGIED